LGDRNIALCISDHHHAPAPWERTADFIYLRGHGPSGRYEGRYSRATLAAWRESIRTWQRDLCDVYAYFDNDQKSAAPMDALALLRLLARFLSMNSSALLDDWLAAGHCNSCAGNVTRFVGC
jgi:uncharacterized protein YecE (DUF72 family)